MSKNNIETFCPSSQGDWRHWLAENHETKPFIWLIYYRSSTEVPSLTWSEAVDEALCFGWIDSTKKTIDKDRYMQYFTKRKSKSTWSRVNKEKVARLIHQGRMTKAGLASVDTAKQNGSWTILDEVEDLVVPEDLQQALVQFEASKEYFDELSKSVKKTLLYWVISAKRAETRRRRIMEIAENAAKGLKPRPFR